SWRVIRTVVTDTAGDYTFPNLRQGAYRLRIQRTGYRPSTVNVDLAGESDASLRIGLVMRPVELEPLDVLANAVDEFQRNLESPTLRQIARRATTVDRQQDYLATDVRTVTAADVQEAVTLA